MARSEVITVERWRCWNESDKRRLVAESLSPEASAVARREGLHPSQLFAWRKAARSGALTAGPDAGANFTPVVIASQSKDTLDAAMTADFNFAPYSHL